METVEHFARISLVTRLLGNEQPLGEKEVEKLHEVRHRYIGGAGPVRVSASGIGSDELLAGIRSDPDNED
jgi:hypothetical protein